MDKRIAAINLDRIQRLALGLEQAVDHLQRLFPLQEACFDSTSVSAADLLAIDGFRARFSDMQDMLGRTMFKTVAQLDEDETPGGSMTTRERIVLMEKRGLIDGRQWQDIREVRNNFAHDYPDEPAEKAANLNAAWRYAPVLLTITQLIVDYLHDKHRIRR